MCNTRYQSTKGFTLVDIMIGAFLLAVFVTVIFGVFQLFSKVLFQSQNKTVALALANEQVEIIRNLSYENVGTEGGSPSGNIPQSKFRQVDGTTYMISTDIIYIDDPLDGTAGELNDSSPADYKKARVEVSWADHGATKSVVISSNFSPPNLESEVEGGTLSLHVNDKESGNPIANAQVKIINSSVVPSISITTITDENGWLSRPGLAPSDQYEIQVTGLNLDEHRTYLATATLDPEPEYSHAQINEGEKTTRYFLLSDKSAINVKSMDSKSNPLPNIPFSLKGGRTIGINPDEGNKIVYSYENDDLITDGDGERIFGNMSGGEYYLEINSSNYAVLTPDLEVPLMIEAGVTQMVSIVLAPVSEPWLRVLVKDSLSGAGIPEAFVRLHGVEYDKTVFSNENGIAIFPFDDIVLENGDYVLEIAKIGYNNYVGGVLVNNFTEQSISLIPAD